MNQKSESCEHLVINQDTAFDKCHDCGAAMRTVAIAELEALKAERDELAGNFNEARIGCERALKTIARLRGALERVLELDDEAIPRYLRLEVGKALYPEKG